MKTFKVAAAQGEIQIRRIGDNTTPQRMKGFTPLAREYGKLIIGHSETGHHHVLDGNAAVFVMDRPPEGMRILRAIVESDTPLVHLRDYDTHAPHMLPPGEYEFRIGREYDPYENLARQQMD
jgi:hypothetical protein